MPAWILALAGWNAGCHTAMRLFRTLQQWATLGAMLSWRPISTACAKRRVRPGQHRLRLTLTIVTEPLCEPLTPRWIT
jgi:hypothetical protein